MLADTLKDQFNDLANRSSNYWQRLAEHTALRIREFGRLQGYKKAKARYYKLVKTVAHESGQKVYVNST